MTTLHLRDADCAATIDPATDACTLCGVDHGGECSWCSGHGFHEPACQSPENEARRRLVVIEEHIEGKLAARIIGVNGTDEPRETAEQMLEMAREHFVTLGMKPGILSVRPAEDELVAAFERVADRGHSYYAFVVGADGVARRRPPARIRVSRKKIPRGLRAYREGRR